MVITALTRKLLRDLWGLRGQALAIAVVIAGGVAMWIIAYSTIDSLEQTQRAFYRETRFAEVFATVKRAPKGLTERLAAVPGVDRVQTRTVAGATLEVAGFDEPITGRLISLPDTGEPLLNKVYLRAGRLPAPRSPDEAVVSAAFAEAHRLTIGDSLGAIINGKRRVLSIVGLGLSPEYVYQIQPGALFPDYKRYGILWLREQPLAAAWGTEGAFNDLTLTLQRDARQAAVLDHLDRLLKPYGGIGAYGRDKQLSHEYLSQELQQLRASGAIVPIIFLGVAAFLLNVVFTRIIEQQREQVAVLKAFGYPNRAVGLHYAALVLLIVTVGALPGIGLGTWMGHGLAAVYSDFFRFPYLHFLLTPGVVFTAVAVAGAAALAGALRAIRRAISLPPAEAMRPEPPATYRQTVIERLGLQRWFDQPTRMIIRHLERKPLKSLMAVLGIAMGGALLFVGLFQEDSIDRMLDVQFNLAQREDVSVTFTDPIDRRALHELVQLPGVLRAEPFRAVPVELRAGHRSHRTAIQGMTPAGDLHRILDADLRPVRVPPGGVLLTDHLADKLGVAPGDEITVEVLEGAQPVRQVRIAGLVSEYIGLSAYMDIDALNRLMREGRSISGVYLTVDGRHRQAVFDALQARPRVASVGIREAAINAFLDTMGETLLIMAFINTILAGSIAFGVVYNSARITLSEQGRELASLRVLGFTRGEISYILIGQLVLMTLAAIPLGFFIGYQFAALIAKNLASDLYRVPLVIEPSTYGFSALVLVVAMLASAAIMRHRLYRLDLVGVLKTRE